MCYIVHSGFFIMFWQRGWVNEINEVKEFRKLYIKYINKQSNGRFVSSRKDIIQDFQNLFGRKLTKGQYDTFVRNLDAQECWNESRGNLPIRDKEDYGVNEKEGLYYSDKYIEIDVNSSLSPEDVLKAHGYDANLWEIINTGSTGSKIGTGNNDEQYFINTYRRITVRPKAVIFNEQKMETMLKNIKHIEVDREYIKGLKSMLLITLFDLHMGLNTADDYKLTQSKIIHKIELEKRNDIYFTIGQDIAHNDNMRGTTSSGTPIEPVDLNNTYDEAIKFYKPMIRVALENANNVHLIYSMGNHDEAVGNGITRILAKMYPQCKVDIRGEHESISKVDQDKYGEYKLLNYHGNVIGLTHGTYVGRKKEKLHDMYMAMFPDEFTMVKERYIITGHHHTDRLTDQNGTSVYSLSTRNKPDAWHVKMGFVGSKKRFTIFEFDEHEMIGSYFV